MAPTRRESSADSAARSVFYNFSGGMESAAMLVVDLERIRDTAAVVRFADTGKHFPEMAESIALYEMLLARESSVEEHW